ncbi:MAG: POTRA domain-containing protein [Verrucomicrobiota bacterium]
MSFFRSGYFYAIVLLLVALSGSEQAHAQTTNAPVVPSFQVSRYEIVGSTALDQSAVDRAMQSATGTNITVPQIRRSLTKLQQAFRDRGYLRAAITVPQQPLINGVVRLHVVSGPNQNEPATAPVTLPAALASSYNFQHFEIYGNSALQPDEIDRLLSPAAGDTANLDSLEKALAQLQATYRERGYYAATVKLPQQVLTDGTVIIKVEEGLTLAAEEALATARVAAIAATNKPAPPRTFEVQHYDIVGNTLLSQPTIDAVITNGIGTNITFAQVQKVLGGLQLAYRERGYASAKVSLPQQQLTNATIRVQVLEGVLVDVRVTGNRYFSSNNVLRALPSVRNALLWKDEVVNSTVLQREVDLANQNRDRTIYPVITPGPEPGTSALELRVKDRLPLHGKVDLNNQNTPGTPDWRINTSLNYANIGQHEHSLGLFYGFSPEEKKPEEFRNAGLFDLPLIVNYGAFYRLPLGESDAVQQQVNSDLGNFGFDEATKQFRLPPPGARPDVTFTIGGSSSDTGVTYGPAGIVSQTPLLTIVSQDSGQELSRTRNAGTVFNLPVVLSAASRFNFTLGADFKSYRKDSYNTNNFIITTVVTNSSGSQTIESRVASAQPLRRTGVDYLPLNYAVTFSSADKTGTTLGQLGINANFIGDDADFIASSYTTDARSSYVKATLNLTREQQLPGGYSLLLRGNGQLASTPLISNEQFALGGLNSVRGYYDGDEYGDHGWFASVEARTPFVTGNVPVWSGNAPVWLRGSVFFDVGQRFYIDDSAVATARRTLSGAGFALSANINNRVDAKVTVAWPFNDSNNTEAGVPRANFSIGAQF